MSQTAWGVVGAAIGYYVGGGPTGAQWGYAIGSTIGGIVNPAEYQGPRLGDKNIQVSTYGSAIPRMWGSDRLAGTVIWKIPLIESESVEGGKGGPETTTYSYAATFAVAVCEARPGAVVRRMWAGGKVIYDISSDATPEAVQASALIQEHMTEYDGNEAQLPDPTMESVEGVGNVEPYRGVFYVVFDELPVGDYGNTLPQLTFELGLPSQDLEIQKPLVAYQIYVQGAASPRPTHHYRDESGTYIECAYHRWVGDGAPTNGYSYQETAVEWAAVAGARTIYYAYTISREATEYSGFFRYTSSTDYAGPQDWATRGVWEEDDQYIIPVASRDSSAFGEPMTVAAFGTHGPTAPLDQWFYLVDHLPSVSWQFNLVLFGRQWELGYESPVAPSGHWEFYSQGPVGGTGPNGGALWRTYYAVYTLPLRTERVLTRDRKDAYETTIEADVRNPFIKELAKAVLPGNPAFCIDSEGNIQPNYTYTIVTIPPEDPPARQLAAVEYRDNALYQQALPPLLLPDDPDYNNTDFWQARRDEAVAEGKMHADVDFPVDVYEYANGVAESFAGSDTISLRTLITEICQEGGLAVEQIDVSGVVDEEVPGYTRTRVITPRGMLDALRTGYAVDMVESGDTIKFVTRGGDVAATLDVSDLAAGHEDAAPVPLETTRAQEGELPLAVSVIYKSRFADYQPGTQRSQRQVGVTQQQIGVELAIVLEDERAAKMADFLLYDAWASRNKRTVKVTRRWCALEPTDVIAVPDGNRLHRVRAIDKTEDGGVITLVCVDDDTAVLASEAVGTPTPGGSNPPTGAYPTVAHLLDLPLLREVDENAGYYVAARGTHESWRGARLYELVGTEYESRLELTNRAVIGEATTVLPDVQGPGNGLDTCSYVDIELVGGELESTTLALMLGGANAAVIGDEIIQFQTATAIGALTYRLSGLLRGRVGTEQHMGTHAIGDRFVLLTVAGVYRQPTGAAPRGVEATYKAVSYGMSLAVTSAIAFTNNAAALMPLSPVHLNAVQSGADTWFVQWQRRTRKGGEWVDGADAVLGEAEELYDVELLDGDTVLSTQRTANRYATVGGSAVPSGELVLGAVLDYTSAVIDLRDWGGDIVGVRYGSIPLRDNGLMRFAADGSYIGVVALGGVLGRILQIDVDGDNVYAAVTRAIDTSFAYRVDRTSMAIEASYAAPLAADVQGVAFDGTHLWVAESYSGNLRKLDGTTLALLDTFALNVGLGHIAYQAGSSDGRLFICDRTNDRIIEFDLDTETVAGYFTGCEFPTRMVVTDACLFVVGRNLNVYDLASRSEIYSNPDLEGFLVETPAGVAVSLSESLPIAPDIVMFSPDTGVEIDRFTVDANFRFLCGYAAGGLWVRAPIAGVQKVVKLVDVISATSSDAALSVRVTQVSATVGAGFPAEIDL